MNEKPNDITKIFPQCVEVEEVVLGAMLQFLDATETGCTLLPDNAMYKESNKAVFAAIKTLYNKQSTVDIVTVTSQLKRAGELEKAGGPLGVTMLTNRVSSGANIEKHCQMILEKYTLREIIGLTSSITDKAFLDREDVFDLLDEMDSAQQKIRETLLGNIEKNEPGLKPNLKLAIQDIETRQSKTLTGVPTNNYELDLITGGYQKGDLIILAARPGIGKTTSVLNFAINAGKQGYKGVIFSLEMPTKRLMYKILSAESDVEGDVISRGEPSQIEWVKINRAMGELVDLGIEVYDKSGVNVNYMRSMCRRFKKRFGQLDFVAIDYLQLMNSVNKNKIREQEISEISRSLKILAKEMDVPVIALAQLSRECEKRSDKRPMDSDLRESGSIEQDADIIQFLYYAAKYYEWDENPDKDHDKYRDEQTYRQVIERIVTKNRNGDAPCRFFEYFDKPKSKFSPQPLNFSTNPF